jgi:CHAD domain-containing protein
MDGVLEFIDDDVFEETLEDFLANLGLDDERDVVAFLERHTQKQKKARSNTWPN